MWTVCTWIHCSCSHKNLTVNDCERYVHCFWSHKNLTVNDCERYGHCSWSHKNWWHILYFYCYVKGRNETHYCIICIVGHVSAPCHLYPSFSSSNLWSQLLYHLISYDLIYDILDCFQMGKLENSSKSFCIYTIIRQSSR